MDTASLKPPGKTRRARPDARFLYAFCLVKPGRLCNHAHSLGHAADMDTASLKSPGKARRARHRARFLYAFCLLRPGRLCNHAHSSGHAAVHGHCQLEAARKGKACPAQSTLSVRLLPGKARETLQPCTLKWACSCTWTLPA